MIEKQRKRDYNVICVCFVKEVGESDGFHSEK